MAAYLLYIKSQTLLPKHEEEEEDPRENLVRMLLEYQRYKAVAAGLQELYTKDCCRAVRAQQEPGRTARTAAGTRPTSSRPHTPASLSGSRPSCRRPFPRSAALWALLLRRSRRVWRTFCAACFKRNTMPLAEAFETAKSRSDVVATFLAVLELTSNKRIRLEGEDDEIRITLRRNR